MIEGGWFQERVWYDYCKYCNLWYPNDHKCSNPPKPPMQLWARLYLKYRQAPEGSTKRKMMLEAWVAALGGKIVEEEPEALAGD